MPQQEVDVATGNVICSFSSTLLSFPFFLFFFFWLKFVCPATGEAAKHPQSQLTFPHRFPSSFLKSLPGQTPFWWQPASQVNDPAPPAPFGRLPWLLLLFRRLPLLFDNSFQIAQKPSWHGYTWKLRVANGFLFHFLPLLSFPRGFSFRFLCFFIFWRMSFGGYDSKAEAAVSYICATAVDALKKIYYIYITIWSIFGVLCNTEESFKDKDWMDIILGIGYSLSLEWDLMVFFGCIFAPVSVAGFPSLAVINIFAMLLSAVCLFIKRVNCGNLVAPPPPPHLLSTASLWSWFQFSI